MGTRLLTYATPAIETAMRDCSAQSSFLSSLAGSLLPATPGGFPLCYTSRTLKQIF